MKILIVIVTLFTSSNHALQYQALITIAANFKMVEQETGVFVESGKRPGHDAHLQQMPSF